jgi:HEAT repeat protein
VTGNEVREERVFAFVQTNLSFDLWYISAIALSGIIVLLFTSILLFRRHRLAGQRRQQRITQEWSPLLTQSLTGSLPSLPALTRRDHIDFLSLWNQSYEFLPEALTTPLVRLAQTVGSPCLAIELLESRLLSQRILAVMTLGRLQERSAWAQLGSLLAHHNSFLAFSAAQALLRIDANAALPLLLPMLGHRADWSPIKIVSMLQSAGQDLASEVLAKAAIQGSPDLSPRLIRYLPVTKNRQGLLILRQFLREESPSTNMLAASLFVFGEFRDPADLPTVRHHLTHEAWYVRVQAATALGKLGTVEDEERLIALFTDDQWWVRYRAGEALMSLESMTEEKLMTLQESLPSPEAQEILAPILAKFRTRRSPIALRP